MRVIVNSLDLTQKDGDLKGISSMFTGRNVDFYVFLEPLRYSYLLILLP